VQEESRRQFLFSMNCAQPRQGLPEKLPLVEGVGTGCQPVPRAYPSPRICVKPGSRLAAGTYWARDLQRGATEESQTVSVLNELRRRRGKALRKLPLVEGVGTGLPAGAWAYSSPPDLREARVPAGSRDLLGPDLQRGAGGESPDSFCSQ